MDEVLQRLASVEAEVEQLTSRLVAALAEVDQLKEALASSRRIGAAIGIVMIKLKVMEETAFDVLRVASQKSNRKLRDVADQIVQTGSVPE